MANNYYTILTNTGKAKITNAQLIEKKVALTHVAVGDGTYNPNEKQTALRNELWRGSISTLQLDVNNPNWLVLEAMIPAEIGGFHVNEVGVFDAEGDLIAIGKYPVTYKPDVTEGSAKDLHIRMIIEVANATSVQLKIDPTIAIPSKEWVGEELTKAKTEILQQTQSGDSGWVELVLQNGVKPYDVSNPPAFRKIGDVVFLRGAMTNIVATDNLTVGLIPNGFWPTKNNTHTFIQNISKNTFTAINYARWTVSHSGELVLQGVSNSDMLTTKRWWFPIDTSYISEKGEG